MSRFLFGKKRKISRRIGLLACVAGALIPLLIAFFAQSRLGMVPCVFCLFERWPYRLIILIGSVAWFFSFWSEKIEKIGFGLILLCLLGSVGLSITHLGIQNHTWASPVTDCRISSVALNKLTDATLFFNSLPKPGYSSCAVRHYLIPSVPLSLTALDLIYACLFMAGVGWYLWKTGKRL